MLKIINPDYKLWITIVDNLKTFKQLGIILYSISRIHVIIIGLVLFTAILGATHLTMPSRIKIKKTQQVINKQISRLLIKNNKFGVFVLN